MANKLSHSAINRFKMCAESYRLHYIEKIRPTGTTGPLIFGAALDNAINALLTYNDETAENIFERQFEYQTINGEETYLPTCPEISYSKADFDHDLLTQADVDNLTKFAANSGLQEYTDHISTYKRIKKEETPSRVEKAFVNYCSWLTLYRKGLLMLNAYRTKVMPMLTKVHSIQEGFSLDNEIGDTLIGVVDLVADVKGYGTVILDNKTAGRPYKDDAVVTSEQLSLYVHALEARYETRKAGYIVLNKNVVKNKVKVCKDCGYTRHGGSHLTCPNEIDGLRCGGTWNITISPDIYVQFLIADIPETMEATVMQDADDVNEKVSCGIFKKNEAQCESWFGQRCPYYNLCHNKSMDGLIKVDKKNGK